MGIGAFAASTATGGAVATVMPLQTGASLLSNMVYQMGLGIKTFDKPMRVGTVILIVAVAELVQLGPSSGGVHQDVDALLDNPQAIAWIACMVIGTIIGVLFTFLYIHHPQHSPQKLISVTAVVTFTTVLGSSVSKCFGILEGTALYVALLVYFVDGIFCLGFTLIAGSQCDVGVFLPVQYSSQLVVNMITGYVIWDDAKYIAFQEAYLCVYFICCCCVYLLSPELDAFGQLLRNKRIRATLLAEGVAPTELGQCVLNLQRLWTPSSIPGERPSKEALEAAWRSALEIGVEQGAITRQEIISLTMRLLSEHGYAPTANVICWMEECAHFKLYAKRDPKFACKIRESLSIEETQKLSLLESGVRPQMTATGASISLQAVQPDRSCDTMSHMMSFPER